MRNKYVYILEMRRWGDPELHSYVVGTYTSLLPAIQDGLDNGEFLRGGKYEPVIHLTHVDSYTPNLVLCDSLESARLLHEEITNPKWEWEPENE